MDLISQVIDLLPKEILCPFSGNVLRFSNERFYIPPCEAFTDWKIEI